MTIKGISIKLTSNKTVYAGWTESDTTNPFADVNKTDWFFEDVMAVYQNGTMTGTGNTTFSPYRIATRAQIAAIFYRLAGSPAVEDQNSFTDITCTPSTPWYYDAVTWDNKAV